jgi:serine O-acetyltransferase
VTLYHGVTLGGVSPSVDSDQQRNLKRHPTLGDGVIVGSGAQILGPIIVGEHARIGANAVVTRDVEPRTTMVGIPAKPVQLSRAEQGAIERFVAYGTPLDCDDPGAADSDAIRDQVALLKARINALEHAINQQAEVGLPSRPGAKEATDLADKLPGK